MNGLYTHTEEAIKREGIEEERNKVPTESEGNVSKENKQFNKSNQQNVVQTSSNEQIVMENVKKSATTSSKGISPLIKRRKDERKSITEEELSKNRFLPSLISIIKYKKLTQVVVGRCYCCVFFVVYFDVFRLFVVKINCF
jgi:hypothetical protein